MNSFANFLSGSMNGGLASHAHNFDFSKNFVDNYIGKNAHNLLEGTLPKVVDTPFSDMYFAMDGARDVLGNQAFDFSKYFQKGADWLGKNYGTLGSLYGAYNKQRMANKQFGLMRDSYSYNKELSERQKRRQEEAERNFNVGFGGK